MRVDQLLVARGLAPSRSAAQRLIDRGAVRFRVERGSVWRQPAKAGVDLPDACDLQVIDDAELRFVSRGGLKLDGALRATGIDIAGRRCLDVGQSTGGFTDVLLQAGAMRVVGIDVGHGQLHVRLRDDPRVCAYEGLNAREIGGSAFEREQGSEPFDFVTGDLSFISSTLVLPTMVRLLAASGDLLLLVKPQFELQSSDIGRGGVVKDERLYPAVETRIRNALQALSLDVVDYFESPVKGGDGNTEFFAWARHRPENP